MRGELQLRKKLTEMIRCVWKIEKILDDWNTVIVCVIYKKGNPAENENYRSISLLNVGYSLNNGNFKNKKYICQRNYRKLPMWFSKKQPSTIYLC